MAGASGARRIVLNRKFLTELQLAAADGLLALTTEIIDAARVPDAPPIGEGLVREGGAIAFVGSKRVGVYATGGQASVRKPRAAKLGKGVTVIGGWGFPARFDEIGTARQPARPFASPALMARVEDAAPYIAAAAEKAGLASRKRFLKGDTFANRRAKA